MLSKFFIINKFIFFLIFTISISNSNIYAKDILKEIKVDLVNINNRPILTISNDNKYRRSIKLIINNKEFHITFINQKSVLPKEFLNNTFLIIKKNNDAFYNSKLYVIINLFTQKLIIHINIFYSLITVIIVYVLLRLIFAILNKILLPIIVLIILIIFLSKSSFITKDIYTNIVEYTNKVTKSVKGLF